MEDNSAPSTSISSSTSAVAVPSSPSSSSVTSALAADLAHNRSQRDLLRLRVSNDRLERELNAQARLSRSSFLSDAVLPAAALADSSSYHYYDYLRYRDVDPYYSYGPNWASHALRTSRNNSYLRGEVAYLQSTNADLNNRVNDLSNDVREKNFALRRSTSREGDLETDLSKVRSSLRSWETRDREHLDYETALEERLGATERTNSDVLQNLTNAESDLQYYRTRLRGSEEEKSSLQRDYTNVLDDMERNVRSKDMENALLRNDIRNVYSRYT